jgi:ABC-type multidrug transport system fused ATPase/permease subunit
MPLNITKGIKALCDEAKAHLMTLHSIVSGSWSKETPRPADEHALQRRAEGLCRRLVSCVSLSFNKPITATATPTSLFGIDVSMVAVALANAVADYGQSLALKYVGQRVVCDMQGDLFDHLMHADISLFHDQSTGRLISRLTNDILLMRQSVSQVFTGLLKESVTMVFLVGLMFWQSWEMSLVAIGILVFAILPMAHDER